jgi:16S rRNA (uracil1498-N3)-methyltransferase
VPPRFYAPALHPDRPFPLPADEAHHLQDVLRLAVGSEVVAFDGRGRQVRARVERTARNQVVLIPIGLEPPAPEPVVYVTLAQALLKRDKMDECVRDATMMGVGSIQPLVTDHVARSKPSGGTRATERWQRIAVASAKQCGRAVVPAIEPLTAVAEFFARPVEASTARIQLVEPTADVPGVGPAALARSGRPAAAILAVGPEGGWSEAEIARGRAAGYLGLTLGGCVLRAEAAPVVALAVLRFLWDDL